MGGVDGLAGVRHVAEVLHVHAMLAGFGVAAGVGEDGNPFVSEAALRVLDDEVGVVGGGILFELLVGALAVMGVKGSGAGEASVNDDGEVRKGGPYPPPAATDSFALGPMKAICFAVLSLGASGRSFLSFFRSTMPSPAAFRRNSRCSGRSLASSFPSSQSGVLYLPVLYTWITRQLKLSAQAI